MKLSPPQISLFWREWSATCKVMRWTREAGLTAAEIDAHRKSLLAGCGFTSLTEVDRTEGFTRVLNSLKLIISGDASISAAREIIDPSMNEARTLRFDIVNRLIPCLELYVPDVRAYLAEALFHQGKGMRELDLNQLDAAHLRRMQFTIEARLNEKRGAAGDTIHEMKKRAAVPCHCAQCSRAKVQIAAPAPF